MATSRKPTGRPTFGRTQGHYNAPAGVKRRVKLSEQQKIDAARAALNQGPKMQVRSDIQAEMDRQVAVAKATTPPTPAPHGPTRLKRRKPHPPTGEHVEPPPGNAKRRRKYIRKAKRHSGSTTSPAASGTEVGVGTIIGGGMALILIGMLIQNGQTVGQILTWLGSSVATIIRNLTNPGGSAGG